MAPKPRIPYRLAKLYTAGNDLSRQWFVYFSFPNPITSELTRKRVYDGFAQYYTIADRMKHGEKLILKINKKLKTGWNPYEGEDSCLTEFRTDRERVLISELFGVLEENKHNLRP